MRNPPKVKTEQLNLYKEVHNLTSNWVNVKVLKKGDAIFHPLNEQNKQFSIDY